MSTPLAPCKNNSIMAPAETDALLHLSLICEKGGKEGQMTDWLYALSLAWKRGTLWCHKGPVNNVLELKSSLMWYNRQPLCLIYFICLFPSPLLHSPSTSIPAVIAVLQLHLQALPIHKVGITSRNPSVFHLIVSLALLNRTVSSRCSSGGQTLKTTNELVFFLGPHSLAVNLKEWLGVKPSGPAAPLSVF